MSRSARPLSLALSLFAVAAGLAGPQAAAQATPETRGERFSERIAVTEVEVPVRVLVRGEPLAGLTRDDFVLLDRGEPQEIVGFRVRTVPGALGAPGAERPAGPPSAAAEAPVRRLMLLFDFANARRNRLARAAEDLRESLVGQLGPRDRIAVVTYGAVSGLNLLVGFTEDREKIGLALSAVEAMLDADDSRQRDLLRRLHEKRFAESGHGSTFEALAAELGRTAALAVLSGPVVYDESEDEGVKVREQESFWGPIRVRVEVDVTEPVRVAQDGGGEVRALGLSLAELAYLLRETGGQKELLLVSEGFSGEPLTDARNLFYLEKALRAFRESGWTVHGIDVAGVAGLGERSFDADSLLYFADGTGGELVENVNDFGRAAERVLERTEIVYVLSFQPSPEGDPADLRKLEVKLARRVKGAKVTHRPGYYLNRPPARREIFERRVDGAEWLLTNLEAAELDVAAYAAVEVDPEGGGVRVPVAVDVGGRSLRGGRKSTRVELQLAALDGGGTVRALLSGETVVQRSGGLGGEVLGEGVRFVGELAVPPGSYTLRVLVRSHREGEVHLATYPLEVSADPAAPPSLPPPPDRGEGWITVEAAQRSAYFR
ncbi:MAG: VWA domain-containing protein [Thermoanaerobaculia bacterium]|nr:VWA domain-containing protein [Thermoanaerobaculia bacterium]